MIIILVCLIIFFFFLLFKSVDLLVVSLRNLAVKSHINIFTITAILMALATSFPEISVAITSGLENASSLSLGNVIGANITNLSFVIGLATILTGSMVIHGGYLRRDILIAGVSGFAPLLLLLDGTLSRVDGLILILVYLAYATSFFHPSYKKISHLISQPNEAFLWRKLNTNFNLPTREGKDLGRFFLGATILIVSADIIVKLASNLAIRLDLPQFIVGLFLLALGTTLPELAFSINALRHRSVSLFYGNILGSVVANSTLVIGLAVVISPISHIYLPNYYLAFITFTILFILFWFFVRSKHRLDRWEAIILFILYLVFLSIELLA